MGLPDLRKSESEVGAMSSAWRSYYASARGQDAHATLSVALSLFTQEGIEPGTAVDLGCGDGRETLELVGRGWMVLAIDREPGALQLLRDQIPPAHIERVTTRCTNLESAMWPPVLLVNA